MRKGRLQPQETVRGNAALPWISHHVWTLFVGCWKGGAEKQAAEKPPPSCHSERSEESRSEYFQRTARFLVVPRLRDSSE